MMALSTGKGLTMRKRSTNNFNYPSMGDFNILEKLTGGAGSSDKPVEVRITHELAPLHEPVVKVSLMIIAGSLLLLLVNSVRK